MVEVLWHCRGDAVEPHDERPGAGAQPAFAAVPGLGGQGADAYRAHASLHLAAAR